MFGPWMSYHPFNETVSEALAIEAHGSNLFHVQAVIDGINYAGSEMCFFVFFQVGTKNIGWLKLEPQTMGTFGVLYGLVTVY